MRARPLALTLAIAAASLASAQPTSGVSAAVQERAAGQMRFAFMDVNNDGRITRDEWKGSERSFINHDWNGRRRPER
jgi:hypothetical protein